MGIRGSKLENSPLVSLCKERKEFTKAAKSCRYDLAAAYTLYTQSLVDVGNALHLYVEQEYLFDPVPEEQSLNNDEANIHYHDSDDDSDFSSVIHHVHGDTEIHDDIEDFEIMESPTSSVDEKHNLPTADASRVNFMKVSKGKPLRIFEQEPAATSSNQSKGSLEHAKMHGNHVSADSSNCDEMVNAGARIEVAPMYDNYFHHMRQGVGSANFPHSDYSSMNYGDGTALQMDMRYGYMHTEFQEQENREALPIAPSSPPQPKSSGWDILYPLSMNYDEFYNNYMQFGFEIKLDNVDSDHVKRVRENEGIPGLEEELEDPAAQAKPKEEVKEGGTKSDEVGGTSKCVKPSPAKDEVGGKSKGVKSSPEKDEDHSDEDSELSDDGDKINEIECENTSDVLALKIIEKEEVRKEAKGTDAEQEAIQENVNVVSNEVSNMLVTSAIGLPEAMRIIRNEFETAVCYGKEVSVILEAGKLPFAPTNTKLKVLASQVLGSFIPSIVTNPRDNMLPNLSDFKRSGTSDHSMNQDIQDVCRKFGDLSSSLEQLYMWEKKLYEEVVNEEKLRLLYDKEYKRLKYLDERGAEPDKINEILISTRKLHSEINVAVAAAEAISKRIHMLRDDELFPQMKELIDGLTRMWRFMSTCHHRQHQAIVNTKSHGHMVDPKIGKYSSPKATLRLEKTILDLGICFSNFIGLQKAFVKYLNEWLLRCIYQEPQETEDGVVPFSPNQLGAPVIFTICNNWHQTIEKISTIPVSKAIEDFSSKLHQLHQKQEEEHLERHKQKQLSKELETRIQSFFNMTSFSLNENASCSIDEKFVLVSGLDENLISLRKRVDEQKAKHEQAIIQVNEFASTCLQEGLVSIFEALKSFCSDSLRAYEQLTVPEVNIQ